MIIIHRTSENELADGILRQIFEDKQAVMFWDGVG